MLYPRVLKEFAESLGEDLIILPSSIHEVLLTPSNVSLPPEELNEMVQAINQSDVPAEERLSDHIYYFEQDSGLSLPAAQFHYDALFRSRRNSESTIKMATAIAPAIWIVWIR